MNIDRDVVLHIARLAHLDLDDAEIELFTRQLGEIVHYVDQLNEVEQPVESFVSGDLNPAATRADEVRPSQTVDEALKNAPQRAKQFFKVPRIIP